MAISGPASYIPTVQEFLAHWDSVNLALGAGGPLVLPSGASVTSLGLQHGSLQAFAATVQSRLNDVEIARGALDLRKEALLGRLGEFNRKVRGFLGKTPYANALPQVPSATSAASGVVQALDDAASLWMKINAATIPGFTGPLTLVGGYAVAAFNTDLAALKTEAQAWQNTQQSLKLEREQRNDLQDAVYPVLRDYRAAVIGTFAPEHALVASLPRLTPEPGSTPDPVTASIAWNAPTQQAKLTWTASDNENLDHYQVRFCPGATYESEIESVVGNVDPSAPRELLTDTGLAAPGDTASFKVYVVLTTENEVGSNAVSIVRP